MILKKLKFLIKVRTHECDIGRFAFGDHANRKTQRNSRLFKDMNIISLFRRRISIGPNFACIFHRQGV